MTGPSHCHLCPRPTIYARGLCFPCYHQAWRASRLGEFPRSRRGVYRIDACSACVTALRVEVSSAMRDDAFVTACPHRSAVAA